MRSAVPFLFLLLLSRSAFAQRVDPTPVCDRDTIQVDHRDLKYGQVSNYRAIRCVQHSRIGLRLELGAAGFRYPAATRSLLGNHGSALLGWGLAYGKWNLGLRFRVWTLKPGRTLLVDNDTLNASAKLNPVTIDYTLGYSFDLPRGWSIEPYLGYSRRRLLVINEEELNKDIDFRTAKGLSAGLTVNKYVRTKNYTFLALFVRTGYAATDLANMHPSLGRGYWEAAGGIAIKGFPKITYLKRVTGN